MGKVSISIRKSLFVIAACGCYILTVYNRNLVNFDAYGTTYLVDEYVEPYYEPLSDNVGLTNINGISNVYINMLAEGYQVYNENITNNSIDVSFVKDNYPSYRYYYTHSDGRITIFSSEYENSYIGVSYINERKE